MDGEGRKGIREKGELKVMEGKKGMKEEGRR